MSVKLRKENALFKAPNLEVIKQTSAIINAKGIPPLPVGMCTLNLPSVENTQLKNNFQVFSEEVVLKADKKNYKAHNWFLSNKVENVTRIRQKGLSLARKRVLPTQEKNINDEMRENNDYDSGSGENNTNYEAPVKNGNNNKSVNKLQSQLNRQNLRNQSITKDLQLVENMGNVNEEENYDY